MAEKFANKSRLNQIFFYNIQVQNHERDNDHKTSITSHFEVSSALSWNFSGLMSALFSNNNDSLHFQSLTVQVVGTETAEV
jgi:hypothetical protein